MERCRPVVAMPPECLPPDLPTPRGWHPQPGEELFPSFWTPLSPRFIMVHLRCFDISYAKGSPAAPCRPCNVEQVETHCLAPFQPQYSALWIRHKHWDYYKQRSQEDKAKVDIGHHRCHHIFLQLFFTVKINDRILLQSCPIEHLAVMPHCLCKEWVTREQALHFQSNKIDWQLVLFTFATERVPNSSFRLTSD